MSNSKSNAVTAEQVLNALHEKLGVCGHCGKRNCASRKSWSKLPVKLDTDKVVSAIEEVFGE